MLRTYMHNRLRDAIFSAAPCRGNDEGMQTRRLHQVQELARLEVNYGTIDNWDWYVTCCDVTFRYVTVLSIEPSSGRVNLFS